MRVTSSILSLFICFGLFSCQEDKELFNATNSFVRFHFFTDNDNYPLEFPQNRASQLEKNEFTHISTKPLKIPIAITGLLQTTPTDVFYSVTTVGTYSDFSFNSPGKLTIPAGKLVDTLLINFNSNWTDFNVNKIKLKITSTSNPLLQIGWPNNTQKNDEFTITLGNLTTTRYALTSNLYEIQGNANEEVTIPIQFTNPIVSQQIGNFNFLTASVVPVSLCDNITNNAQFTLTKEPLVAGSMTLNYTFKLTQAISNPVRVKIELNNGLPNFVRNGISEANVFKAENVTRSGDPAANWYNTADNFHRNYGKAWYFNTTVNQCRWGVTFSTFTKPVLVSSSSPFNNGNGNHRFRIGYKSPTNIGTNPFDFVRYYAGASAESPGFTIPKALEFFPDNGNSATNGVVKVIPQTLVFLKLSNDQPVSVPICGGGTYWFDPINNRRVMYLEIRCDETQINGNNNVIRQMYIYSNNNSNTNPANLTVPCSNRLNL